MWGSQSQLGRCGKRSDRPRFQEMLEAAARREYDVLVFWCLDRLTREGALATLGIWNCLPAEAPATGRSQRLIWTALGRSVMR